MAITMGWTVFYQVSYSFPTIPDYQWKQRLFICQSYSRETQETYLEEFVYYQVRHVQL